MPGALIHILTVNQGDRCFQQGRLGALLDIHHQDRRPGPLVTNRGNPSQTSIG